jgi:RNA polymerase sigma-70 factor (ECF subfamily)
MTCPEEFEGTQAEALTASMAARRELSPPAAAMAAESKRLVADALEELDEEFRLVVVLRDIEGMNYAEISEVTALPVGTVKSRLHRARMMLREKLAGLID